jgi:hypothetical protein
MQPQQSFEQEQGREPTPVAARLTLTHRDGSQTVIEVHADAGFQKFYRWYQRAPQADAKHLTRVSMRNDAADLAEIEARTRKHFDNLARGSMQWAARQIVDAKLVVIDAPFYKKLLAASPVDLPGGGLARVSVPDWMMTEHYSRPRGATRVPVQGYTTLQRRMDIMTGGPKR